MRKLHEPEDKESPPIHPAAQAILGFFIGAIGGMALASPALATGLPDPKPSIMLAFSLPFLLMGMAAIAAYRHFSKAAKEYRVLLIVSRLAFLGYASVGFVAATRL